MKMIYICEGNGEVQLDVLKSICGNTDGKSMIDIGSGFCPNTRKLGFTEKLYIDIVERDIVEEKPFFRKCNILVFIQSVEYLEKIDVSISLDNIEHFYKDDAIKILNWMVKNTKKQIIFTPLGDYIKTSEADNTNPDTHKSGWLPKDFEDMGWATIVFKNFHPKLNLGAFFAFKCSNINDEFTRVINELNNKKWANLSK
jgi:hypothetical protein